MLAKRMFWIFYCFMFAVLVISMRSCNESCNERLDIDGVYINATNPKEWIELRPDGHTISSVLHGTFYFHHADRESYYPCGLYEVVDNPDLSLNSRRMIVRFWGEGQGMACDFIMRKGHIIVDVNAMLNNLRYRYQGKMLGSREWIQRR